jgi:hypothetical protein
MKRIKYFIAQTLPTQSHLGIHSGESYLKLNSLVNSNANGRVRHQVPFRCIIVLRWPQSKPDGLRLRGRFLKMVRCERIPSEGLQKGRPSPKTPKHDQVSTDKISQPASRRLYGDPRPLNNAFTVLPALSPLLLTGYWIL